MSIDLQAFCGDGEIDFRIGSPFSKGEWTYATNGHIIVRVPLVAGLREDGPNADKIFENATKGDRPSLILVTPELPPLSDAQAVDCDDCDGTGLVHDCPSCDCKCEECSGTGLCDGASPDKAVSVQIGDVPFACEYIRLVSALPGLRITRPIKEKPWWFSFDGGEGILMPLRAARETNIVAKI